MRANTGYRARPVLATAIVAGFFLVVAAILVWEAPEANREAFLVLLGVLTKSLSDVVAFYFGSSQGSAEKQEQINRLMEDSEPPE